MPPGRRTAAHRLEPRPKSRLAEDTLLLGDTPVDVLKAVGAVLTHVCSAAARQARCGRRIDAARTGRTFPLWATPRAAPRSPSAPCPPP